MSTSVADRSRYEVVPYQFYARTGSGHTPSRSNEEYWKNCDIPWVTTADVKHLRDGRQQVLEDTEVRISVLGMANSAARLHPAGTVVLSRTASVGFSGIMGRDMATSQDFVTWSPSAGVESRYLLWVLRAMKGAGDFDRLMYGSTHKTIYVPDLQQLRGPLPSPEVQRRIADYLDTEAARIDSALDANRRLDALLDERFEAVRSSLLWPHSSSPLHDGDGLSKVQYVTLARTGGKTPSRSEPRYWELHDGSGTPWLAIADITAANGEVLNSSERVTSAAVSELPLRLVSPGTLLYAMYASLGKVARLGVHATHNQAVLSLQPDGRVIDSDYLLEWLKFLEPYVRSEARSNTQPNLSGEQVGRLPVRVPQVARQRELVKVLNEERRHVRAVRRTLGRQEALLLERRQALITAAVTGELEV